MVYTNRYTTRLTDFFLFICFFRFFLQRSIATDFYMWSVCNGMNWHHHVTRLAKIKTVKKKTRQPLNLFHCTEVTHQLFVWMDLYLRLRPPNVRLTLPLLLLEKYALTVLWPTGLATLVITTVWRRRSLQAHISMRCPLIIYLDHEFQFRGDTEFNHWCIALFVNGAHKQNIYMV